jgi:hypothetical protein
VPSPRDRVAAAARKGDQIARKEKPDPCGSGCSLSARGPTITFQRGTAAGITIAIWEDGQPVADNEHPQYAQPAESHNTKARMTAMRTSQFDDIVKATRRCDAAHAESILRESI